MKQTQRSQIERQIANVEKKIWRFKKNKNRPIDLLKRVRDHEIPQVQSQIQAYNAVVDVYDAQRNAVILSEYIASRSMPVFRRRMASRLLLTDLQVERQRMAIANDMAVQEICIEPFNEAV